MIRNNHMKNVQLLPMLLTVHKIEMLSGDRDFSQNTDTTSIPPSKLISNINLPIIFCHGSKRNNSALVAQQQSQTPALYDACSAAKDL
mgnify:CR=1 FL=1